MDIKKNKPVIPTATNSVAQTGNVKQAEASVVGSARQATVEPPAPSARRPEPFVGAKTAAQIGRISQLKGTDPENGSVAYTRPLSPPDFGKLAATLKGAGIAGFEAILDKAESTKKFPRVSDLEALAAEQGKTAAFEKVKTDVVKHAGDPFDKVGIFFEAEAKLTLIDDAEGPVVKERVLAAGDAGKLRGLLPDNYKGPFADWTVKWDRDNSRSGADFHDIYGDDKNNNAAKVNSSMRERTIGGTKDGKFESKLPASDVQGSAVLGRLECAKSTGPTRRSKQSLIDEAIKVIDQLNAKGLKDPDARAAFVHTLSESEKENPMVLMAIEIPEFDARSFTDKLKVDDIRHQLVIQDHSGKDMFLLTLDFVTATRIDTGKVGNFVEFEIERMDGSTAKPGLSELIELTNTVGKALGLTKSPANKYSRGMQVTE
jgi:hypothetical protein